MINLLNDLGTCLPHVMLRGGGEEKNSCLNIIIIIISFHIGGFNKQKFWLKTEKSQQLTCVTTDDILYTSRVYSLQIKERELHNASQLITEFNCLLFVFL